MASRKRGSSRCPCNRAVGFEIHSSPTWKETFNKGLNVLLQSGDIRRAFGVYRGPRVLKVGHVTVLPWERAIRMASEGSCISAS